MTVRYRHLLAKSSSDPLSPRPQETLLGHLREADLAAQTVLAHSPHVLAAAGLELDIPSDLLAALLCRAALLHDLGKANSDFQAMVQPMVRRKGSGQYFRHEQLSVWLCAALPDFAEWFFAGMPASHRHIVLLAVLGHHLKFPNAHEAMRHGEGGSPEARMLLGHRDVAEILRWFAGRLDLATPPTLQDRGLPVSLDELRPLLIEAGTWFDAAPPAEKRLLAVVKALLIACDVAGSALPRTGCSVPQWIADTLGRSLATADLEQLVSDALDGHSVRPFQAAVRDAGPLAFVRAGCGSGKTAAAYLWASRHANGRRLFFCYPTTGTATEGFRDYALESELAPNARLLHGRASVDLEDILGAEPEEDAHHAARLQALEAWPSLLVVCTVDRVLGLIQNYRSSLFAFPALAASAFVFDEIHLFDRRLFGALLRFLEDGLPGAPVLLMTASLPASRRQLLEEVARRRGAPLEIINGPRDLEDLPRYELLGTRAEPPWDMIEATLAHGARNKILWVANTVSRAMDFAVQARERGLGPVLSYHSRFKYEDRVARHADVIRAFRSPGPALAISTQVCEVSLDISADLLVSDLAPVPALIQRLGRLNRRARPGACQPRPAFFLETNCTLPYPEAEFDIDRTRAWVDELAGRPVSQTDLANAFSERDQGEDSPSLESEWLDGGIHAFPAPVRETNQGLSVILAADEAACKGPNGHPNRDQLIRKTLPMGLPPRGHYWPGWPRLGFTPVVPDGLILYSEQVGASWQRR